MLPDVKDRSFLLSFYKRSRKSGLDVQAYNELRDSIYRLEQDLQRLRDPLQVSYIAMQFDIEAFSIHFAHRCI